MDAKIADRLQAEEKLRNNVKTFKQLGSKISQSKPHMDKTDNIHHQNKSDWIDIQDITKLKGI